MTKLFHSYSLIFKNINNLIKITIDEQTKITIHVKCLLIYLPSTFRQINIV